MAQSRVWNVLDKNPTDLQRQRPDGQTLRSRRNPKMQISYLEYAFVLARPDLTRDRIVNGC